MRETVQKAHCPFYMIALVQKLFELRGIKSHNGMNMLNRVTRNNRITTAIVQVAQSNLPVSSVYTVRYRESINPTREMWVHSGAVIPCNLNCCF